MDSKQQKIADAASKISAQAAEVSADAAKVAANAQMKADKEAIADKVARSS